MSVKFKIGLTITAETLFGILAKFLPIEDLTVEEVPATILSPRPAPKARLVAPPKPKRLPTRPVDLHNGINGIIMRALADGKGHHTVEIRQHLSKSKYSPSSLASRLEELRKKDVIARVGIGAWKLSEGYQKTGMIGAGPELASLKQ